MICDNFSAFWICWEWFYRLVDGLFWRIFHALTKSVYTVSVLWSRVYIQSSIPSLSFVVLVIDLSLLKEGLWNSPITSLFGRINIYLLMLCILASYAYTCHVVKCSYWTDLLLVTSWSSLSLRADVWKSVWFDMNVATQDHF